MMGFWEILRMVKMGITFPTNMLRPEYGNSRGSIRETDPYKTALNGNLMFVIHVPNSAILYNKARFKRF